MDKSINKETVNYLIPLTQQQWSTNLPPLVSICCITYNHENYIKDAIEGFLMQKTTFPVDIIIHDDASTDNTAKIVQDYAEKYCDLITPIYQTVNKYSQGIKPLVNFVFPRARGKYIALCEGDDYWTDPLKLQKQVDFLEENEEYGLVHTHCNSEMKGNNNILQASNRISSGYVFKELLTHEFFISTLTVCVRRELVLKWLKTIHQPSIERKWEMGDYPLWLEGALHSKFKFLPDNTATYRILQESASHSTNKLKKYNFFKSVYDIKFYFLRKIDYNSEVKEKILNNYYKGILQYSRYDLKESFLGIKYLIKKKQITTRLIFKYFKNLFS